MPPSMPQPDTGTFNRLLTSVGLILMAAALVVPYFYYRGSDSLEVESSELRRLTPIAQNAIEARQNDIANIQPLVIPLSAATFIVGVAFLVWGGYRLRTTQDRDDREAEARTIIAEAGVRDLTPQEKEDKIAEENAPAPRADGEREDTRRTAVTQEAPATDAPVAGAVQPDARAEERRSRLEVARRIEFAVSGVLASADFPRYKFRPQVGVGRLKLDGLFLAEDADRPDIILEVRVAQRFLALSLVDRTLARAARYQAERGRPCRVWLIVVTVAGNDQVPVEDPGRLADRLNRGLSPLGSATVIGESDLDRLPSLFPGAPSS